MIGSVCAILGLEPERVKTPSKSRAPSEACGIICYIAVRELGYKGKEVGQELRLGPTGVSIAVRRGENVLMNSPELKIKALSERTE